MVLVGEVFLLLVSVLPMLLLLLFLSFPSAVCEDVHGFDVAELEVLEVGFVVEVGILVAVGLLGSGVFPAGEFAADDLRAARGEAESGSAEC